MSSNKPIGFFDSGIGGLTVLREACDILPNEDYIYYGDNKNAPYGDKKEEQIQELTLACGEFLFRKGVKAIVIACNTATSTAVFLMREKYKFPVISMEPAVKPAVQQLKNGKVLVLATPVTVSQQRYKQLLHTVGHEDRIISVGMSGLVELVEAGDFASPAIEECFSCLLQDYEGMETDAIVLGCTHYSFLRENISNYAKRHLKGNPVILDGNGGTVRQLKRVLLEKDLLNNEQEKGTVEFFSSMGHDIKLYEKLFTAKDKGFK